MEADNIAAPWECESWRAAEGIELHVQAGQRRDVQDQELSINGPDLQNGN